MRRGLGLADAVDSALGFCLRRGLGLVLFTHSLLMSPGFGLVEWPGASGPVHGLRTPSTLSQGPMFGLRTHSTLIVYLQAAVWNRTVGTDGILGHL